MGPRPTVRKTIESLIATFCILDCHFAGVVAAAGGHVTGLIRFPWKTSIGM